MAMTQPLVWLRYDCLPWLRDAQAGLVALSKEVGTLVGTSVCVAGGMALGGVFGCYVGAIPGTVLLAVRHFLGGDSRILLLAAVWTVGACGIVGTLGGLGWMLGHWYQTDSSSSPHVRSKPSGSS